MFTIRRNFNLRAQYGSELMNSLVICEVKMLLENNLLYSNRVNIIYSQTSVQHDFWWKVKNHIISSFMLYGGFAYIIPLSMKEHMVGIKKPL